ncbi:MAG: hypothetical protein ACYCO3_09955 [Mycobacteriales bacterium]
MEDLRAVRAGATDARAARALGASPRTVIREMERINAVLGSRTRFQTGIQASCCGWL